MARGFYAPVGNYRPTVHELRDGDYPLCGAGSRAVSPAMRTERPVNCPRCERCMGDDERAASRMWLKDDGG